MPLQATLYACDTCTKCMWTTTLALACITKKMLQSLHRMHVNYNSNLWALACITKKMLQSHHQQWHLQTYAWRERVSLEPMAGLSTLACPASTNGGMGSCLAGRTGEISIFPTQHVLPVRMAAWTVSHSMSHCCEWRHRAFSPLLMALQASRQ